MFQTMMVAALFAQPPAAKPAPPPKDPLAEAVTRAVQTHPDIRVAEAGVQVAQAKLAQAKLQVTMKVTAAHAERDRMRSAVEVAMAGLVRLERLAKGLAIGQEDLLAARSALVVAQANLAKVDAEWQALLGPPPAEAAGPLGERVRSVAFAADGRRLTIESADGSVRLWDAVTGVAITPGSPAEKLKAVLDKPVKFGGAPGIGIKAGYEAVLKAAGTDLRIRVPAWEDPEVFKEQFQVKFHLPAAEYPLATWLELIGDAYAQAALVAEKHPEFDRPKRYESYLREYGLLVTDPKQAPPGAITVSDLWNQVRAEKAAKEKLEKR